MSNKLYNFASSIVGNRVLDIYLKYMGIKTLTTATLVPMALILGKDAFESIIKDIKQTGGADLPVLDDPLIGNYLKIAGITTLSVSPQTLVPLGILMFIYDLYKQKESQTGGNIGKYVKRVYGNRVADLFLKYMGIKTLTTVTLVPFALIMGKDYLESVLTNKQKGGALIPDDFPVIDDPLLGNYLKMLGLSVLSIRPDTLIPLGLLMVIYNTYYAK